MEGPEAAARTAVLLVSALPVASLTSPHLTSTFISDAVFASFIFSSLVLIAYRLGHSPARLPSACLLAVCGLPVLRTVSMHLQGRMAEGWETGGFLAGRSGSLQKRKNNPNVAFIVSLSTDTAACASQADDPIR